MYIDVGQETISKDRLKVLLENSLDYINQDVEYDPIRFVEETTQALDIDEEELEMLGYDEAVENMNMQWIMSQIFVMIKR